MTPGGPRGQGQDTQDYQAPILWGSLWMWTKESEKGQWHPASLLWGPWAGCRAELLSPVSVTKHCKQRCNQQTVIFRRSRGWKSHGELPANVVSGGTMPGSRMTAFSLCPHLLGRTSPLL